MPKKNLFVCGTPFQLFIAQNIIAAENRQAVSILYLGNPKHPKAIHYLSLFAPTTPITYFWIDHELQHLKKTAINLKAKELAQKLGHHEAVYIANYTISFYGFLLSHLPFDSLYSFDDGADNINKLSPLYQFHNQNLKQSLSYALKYALRYRLRHQLRLHPKKILQKIKRHYTIFPQHSNIVSPTQALTLQAFTQPPPTNTATSRPNIKLFIGAYFSDMLERSADVRLLMSKLETLSLDHQIDLYLPHPRETTYHLPNIKHIHILAEEYIVAKIAAGFSVELYGFASTVQLNLSGMKHVKNHLIMTEQLHPKIRHLYHNICDTNFNILNLD